MTAPRLVVLGAGFGGLSFLRTLEKDPVSRALEVMLVDRNAYTTLVPELYAVAAGTADAGAVTVPIRLPERRFRQAEVSGLDPASREVLLTSGRLGYDYLVVALGSRNQFYGVLGAAEHTRTLRTLEEAMAVRQEIQHLPAGASVAVVGGGLTGFRSPGQGAGGPGAAVADGPSGVCGG